jgi:hypothetical protein
VKAVSLIITVYPFFFCSYHIAGSKGIYYAREPYSNVDAVHVTRFIGLASVGNKDKQVRLFFFSIPVFVIECICFSYGEDKPAFMYLSL